jgi:hypothetical protein
MMRQFRWVERRAARRGVSIRALSIIAMLLTPVSAPVAARASAVTCRGHEATLVGGPVRLVVTPVPTSS